MAPGRPASAEAVGSATAAALGLAAAEGLASVALPALGTGVGGVPLEAAAAAMAAAVRDHAAGPGPVPTVVFVLYDRAALERFGAALERELGAGDGSWLDHLAAGGCWSGSSPGPGRWSALPTATSA